MYFADLELMYKDTSGLVSAYPSSFVFSHNTVLTANEREVKLHMIHFFTEESARVFLFAFSAGTSFVISQLALVTLKREDKVNHLSRASRKSVY